MHDFQPHPGQYVRSRRTAPTRTQFCRLASPPQSFGEGPGMGLKSETQSKFFAYVPLWLIPFQPFSPEILTLF